MHASLGNAAVLITKRTLPSLGGIRNNTIFCHKVSILSEIQERCSVARLWQGYPVSIRFRFGIREKYFLLSFVRKSHVFVPSELGDLALPFSGHANRKLSVRVKHNFVRQIPHRKCKARSE